ncbi:Alpha/Beta hydrolase protein [Xylaria intraflava]|nr:Alpha/Beta hydrolase protein [Xylaria intraflava]
MSDFTKDTTEVDTAEVTSIHDVGPPPLDEDYVNPAAKNPRWLLAIQTFIFRVAAYVGFGLGNRRTQPPTETVWLDSTLGEWKGKQTISANVWVPPETSSDEKRPAVINFHGGGFILGSGTDDTQWANTLVNSLGAVVFSVNYRLAPGYPFPTPIEDCVDAILQISELADRYNFDKNRIVLSGFSAGGTLVASSWLILQDPARWKYDIPASRVPGIAGLVLYYPLLDWTLDRPQKRKACARPDLTLSSNLTDLIDASYLYPPRPRRERNDPRLSPGLMPDELVDRLPPVHLCLCEYDMLLAEGKLFAERLEGHGRRVGLRVVTGEKHAWDKTPMSATKGSVAVEYSVAISAVREWFGGA